MTEHTCPKCGGHQFEMAVLTNIIVVFKDDDHEVHEGPPTDVEWDHNTRALCSGCGHEAPLHQMKGTP